ncbi:hypothetical protein Hanom_Chr00s003562g01713441 [Helianthus anomalus]
MKTGKKDGCLPVFVGKIVEERFHRPPPVLSLFSISPLSLSLLSFSVAEKNRRRRRKPPLLGWKTECRNQVKGPDLGESGVVPPRHRPGIR